MPKPSDLHVQINFYFDLDGSVSAFAKLREFIAHMEDTGISIGVEPIGVSDPSTSSANPGSEPPPTTSTPRKRGRSRDKDKGPDKDRVDALDLAQDPAPSPNQTAPPLGEFDDLDHSDDDPEADELGLSPLNEPSSVKSGAEAKEDAMVIIRAAWAMEDKPKHFPYRADVKTLQSKLGVASFRDIPDTDGHRLYKLALEMAEATGLRS